MNLRISAPTESSSHSALNDGADFVELSLLSGLETKISLAELQHKLERTLNNNEDPSVHAEDIFGQLEDRETRLTTSYPFRFTKGGYVICHDRRRKIQADPYRFLLTMTPYNMSSKTRRLRNLDPTHLFERLCRYAVAGYLAPDLEPNECSVVLGSSRGSEHPDEGFQTLFERFLMGVGTSDMWRMGEPSPRGGDGGFDIACWKRDATDRPGAACIFAQCKSGEHWDSELNSTTQPEHYLARFSTGVHDCPTPVSAYMTPCCIPIDQWSRYARIGRMLLFDRIRIVRFLKKVPKLLHNDCKNWMQAALAKVNKT